MLEVEVPKLASLSAEVMRIGTDRYSLGCLLCQLLGIVCFPQIRQEM